jgi:hypothetical protein
MNAWFLGRWEVEGRRAWRNPDIRLSVPAKPFYAAFFR